MKVLFVNENIGGHATVHHHLRRALVDHPDVAATFFDVPAPSMLRRIASAPVPGLARLDLDFQPLRSQLALSLLVRQRIRRLVGAHDVVHLYTQNAGLLSASLLRRRPTVVSLDTTNARNAYRLPYRAPTRFTRWTVPLSILAEKRVFAAAHTVIANSQWAADSLLQDYGLPEHKVEVLPFGITAPVDLDRSAMPSRPRIVFLGRQFDRKGGPVLLEAWRRSVADRADLVLVTMDAIPSEPGLTVINDLAPGDDRLWAILAECSLLAFPSTIDQAPNAVIEAMAAGLPVIAVPMAGVTEMVVDGQTGRHVAGGDVGALANALTELIDDAELRGRMSRAARHRFETLYDARRSTARLMEVLRRAAASDGAEAWAA